MRRGLRIARLAGIDVRLDPTLIFIFLLIVFVLGAGHFRATHPDWGEPLLWGLAVVAAVLFLASILLHELAHSLVAKGFGLPVRDITLFLFGGVSNIEREPPSPGQEFTIAVVGPITSVALGIGFGTVVLLNAPGLATAADPVAAMGELGPLLTMFAWLAQVNVLLGVFNLVPGFPLDGGRILRALLWAVTGSLTAATRVASAVGQAFGWTFVFVGVAMAFGVYVPVLGTGFGGLWLALIGWFLVQAAAASYRELVVRTALGDVPVGRIMTRDVATVPPDLTVDRLVEDFMTARDQRAYPVVERDRMVGLVCLDDVRRLPRSEWAGKRVSEVMTARDKLVVTTPDTPADEAMRLLSRRDVDQLPVVQNGHVDGLLRRRDVLRWLELHADLPGGSTAER
jgi:Zn-dependent protease/predicted transcriptional regulator